MCGVVLYFAAKFVPLLELRIRGIVSCSERKLRMEEQLKLHSVDRQLIFVSASYLTARASVGKKVPSLMLVTIIKV